MSGYGDGLILGFPEGMEAAQRLAQAAGRPCAAIALHRFPDGETRVRLPAELPPGVVFYRSLDDPNAKLVELALAARTARTLGARHLTLVAPYLCYMRQDKAFAAGEAVSQQIVGRLLADWFDALITVDPHLHRVHDLAAAVPVTRAVRLSATDLMADFVAERFAGADPLLVGPDAESEQWVAAVAAHRGLDYRVGVKARRGDRDVEVRFPPHAMGGRHLVLVDDVASTGRTLTVAARALARQRPASISVLVTHPLFVGEALAQLEAAGVAAVWSADSIPHPSNRLTLAPLLAAALAPPGRDDRISPSITT
ncbi:ribose-phosphate pyrophosphokinase [Thioflavicoccus mobilis 8321]|uniref:Ribose-phosphate pyrophosphokinase n=1 Tax=Thioflavicoccus mobilis 8321 TaxID=765912 RepID=L0H3U7_9GAMM|nr:ribose-phosphate diphosphokinase [Thioflavicoccus mobilis]AGA92264.1 ribose-phosphate pyrophosphokinase [Thioflavicoccus mobilis 8321]